jgi:hypothetical protein
VEGPEGEDYDTILEGIVKCSNGRMTPMDPILEYHIETFVEEIVE